jgi:hypothetical protein
MAQQSRRKLHALSLIHIVAMLGIAVWWGAFFWEHTPARDVFRLHRPRPAHVARAKDKPLPFKMESLSAGQGARVLVAGRAAAGDVTFGLVVLVFFAIGSGVYVRRLETWLQARSSGAAVAFGGGDLAEAAVAANQREKGLP